MLRNPVDIDIPEDRAGRFAAIGTLEAVDLFKNFFVDTRYGLVQFSGLNMSHAN
jgi:hypothetical protein